MAFAKAANRWIAGHDPDAIAAKRDQYCVSPHARRSCGSLAARMTPADHDDVALFHVKHSTLFSDAEPREDFSQQGFNIHLADKRFHGTGGQAQIFGHQFARLAASL